MRGLPVLTGRHWVYPKHHHSSACRVLTCCELCLYRCLWCNSRQGVVGWALPLLGEECTFVVGCSECCSLAYQAMRYLAYKTTRKGSQPVEEHLQNPRSSSSFHLALRSSLHTPQMKVSSCDPTCYSTPTFWWCWSRWVMAISSCSMVKSRAAAYWSASVCTWGAACLWAGLQSPSNYLC